MTNGWLLKRLAVAMAVAGFVGGLVGYFTYKEDELATVLPFPDLAA